MRRNVAKKDAANPTTVRRRELSAAFALGHPDGKAPARVRNFGGLGKDVTPITPQSRAERERAAIQAGQEHLAEVKEGATQRARERQTRTEGVSGGQTTAPQAPQPSRAQTARAELAAKRAEASRVR